MKLPNELKEYLKTIQKGSYYKRFAETVQKMNGKITLRLWSIRFNKSDKEPLVKEVFRKNETQTYTNTDFYFCSVGGWVTVWKKKRYLYYGIFEPENRLYKSHLKLPNVDSKKLWDYKIIRELDPDLKYFFVDDGVQDIIEYIKVWRKNPMLELLSKNGWQHLYTDSRVFKLEGKKKKAFIQFLSNKENLIQKPNYNQIINCINNHITLDEYHERQEIKHIQKELKEFNFLYDLCKDIRKYLNNQKCYIDFYKDYLNMAKELNMNVNDRGVLFPRNISESHDNLVATKLVIKNKKFDNKIQKIYKKLADIQISNKDLKVVIPKNSHEIIELGEKLHNCVGKAGYIERMAQGEILIVAVYKGEYPIECCELMKTKKSLNIQQLRGDHNQDSLFHQKANTLINNFIKIYKQKILYEQLSMTKKNKE